MEKEYSKIDWSKLPETVTDMESGRIGGKLDIAIEEIDERVTKGGYMDGILKDIQPDNLAESAKHSDSSRGY